MTNLRKFLCAMGVAGALCIPAFAQYQPQEQPRQHDQDDMQRDRDQNNVQHDRDDMQRDRDDVRRDRDNDRDRANVNNGYYNQNNNDQWRNTKAWKQGFKDGQHDRSRNMGERLDRHHWRNDQDRQAYQAGYYEAYRGSNMTRDRDDQRRDRDDH